MGATQTWAYGSSSSWETIGGAPSRAKNGGREKSTFTAIYRKVASSSPSRIEAHAGLFRLLMKGIFDPYVLWPFDKKLIF